MSDEEPTIGLDSGIVARVGENALLEATKRTVKDPDGYFEYTSKSASLGVHCKDFWFGTMVVESHGGPKAKELSITDVFVLEA